MVTHNTQSSTDPRFSATYPQRVHVRERAHWQEVLSGWEKRIATAREELAARPNQSVAQRSLSRMEGARDQIRDAAERLYGEVGDLYDEDIHRLTEAVRALERLFERW